LIIEKLNYFDSENVKIIELISLVFYMLIWC